MKLNAERLCHRLDILITVKHDASESASVSVFRWREGDAYSVESLTKSWPQSLEVLNSLLPFTWRRKHNSFRNVVFSCYLEFRTMDEVQKPSDSECCSPFIVQYSYSSSRNWVVSVISSIALSTVTRLAVRLESVYGMVKDCWYR
jgi:hypothetical protein